MSDQKCQTQSWIPQLTHLVRVNEAAKRSRQTRFTSLFHHINVEALHRAFKRLRINAATGVDGMTVDEYAQNLGMKLKVLCDKVHGGRYKPMPVRRTYIQKADGGKRPLGVVALEDKIVQSAMAELLNAIYEADFLHCSYGFRPGRHAHQALRTVHDSIMTERANWVLDADIRKFFDSVDHEWLIRMLQHRIADRRVINLIRLWLDAGVMEHGLVVKTLEGTPQGSGISPLLANVYLHYILDLWIRQWSNRKSQGKTRLVRYADDFLLTFEKEFDARRLLRAIGERLAKFGISLHESKTKLIEFGKYSGSNRLRRQQGKPETFNFLGFTHYCSKNGKGNFVVKRKTQRQRLVGKLKSLRREMKLRMHLPFREQHAWLRRVLNGHYAYYGVTGNARCIGSYYHETCRAWHYWLRRRSQRRRLSWVRFSKLLEAFPLPTPRIVHNSRAVC